MITLFQILLSPPNSINKYFFGYRHLSWYNLTLITTPPDFLVCDFHYYYGLSNFIFISLPIWIVFMIPPLPPNPSNSFFSCNYVFIASYPFQFVHYYSYAPCNTGTFHVPRHLDRTIMFNNSRTASMSEHCLCTMFFFNQVIYIYLRMSCMILITWP